MALLTPTRDTGAVLTIAAGALAGRVDGNVAASGIRAGMELIPGSATSRASVGQIIESWVPDGTSGADFTLAEPFRTFAGADYAGANAPFVADNGGGVVATDLAVITNNLRRALGLETTLEGESKDIALDRADSAVTFGRVSFSRARRLWGDLVQRTVAGAERLALRAFPDGATPVEAIDIDLSDGTIDWREKSSDVAVAGGIADIGSARTARVRITGGGNVTSLGAVANKRRLVTVAAATTFVHANPSLVLPGAVNMAAAVGDMFEFGSGAAGNWVLLGRYRGAAADARADLALGTMATEDKAVYAPKANPVFTGLLMFPVITQGGMAQIEAGTGDGASYTTYNTKISFHYGLGLGDYGGRVFGFYDARQGVWDVKGGYRINGSDIRGRHRAYTIGTLPAASAEGGSIVFASELGLLVFSNGVNWLRLHDNSFVV